MLVLSKCWLPESHHLPRSTIALVAKYARDVLEVFYAEPVLSLDQVYQGYLFTSLVGSECNCTSE
jgi:hypothetical protein